MSWLEILKEHPEYSEKAKNIMSGNVYLKDTGGYLSRQAAADYIKKNQSTQQATSLKAKQEQIGRFLIDNAAEFKKARIEQGRKNVYQNRAPVFPNADGTKPSIKEASIENTVKNSGDFWENYKNGLKSADNKIEFSKAFETIDINGGTGKVSDYDAVKAMTSEQMRTYNYLLGKYGTKRANQYFENVRDANTSKINNIVDNDIRQTVKNEGIRGKGFAVGANLATGITAPIAYAESAISAATNKPIDVNSAAQRATRNASVSHDALTENMGYWGRTLTDVGLSMGKSALAMGMGALTGSPAAATVIMGLDAAAAKTYENAQKGVSARRNFADATLTGIAEGFFEKFSIGNFMKMSGIAKTGIKDIAVQLLKQAGVEASEEAATEIADNLIDFFILGNKSDVKQYYNDLLEQGESKSAAAAKTLWQYGAVNPAQSALGGAISGAGFGMVGATGGYINTKNEGARLNMTGEAGELINSASDGRYGDRAAKMAQDIQLNRLDGKQAKDIDVGNLQRAASEYLQNQKEEAKKNIARAKRAETMENIRTRAADFADGVYNAAVNFSDGVHNVGAKAADSVRNVFRMRGEDGAENTQEQHTPEQLKVMREYENAVDSELLDFVRYAKENPSDNKTNLKLNSVSDRLSKDIKNAIGIDVSGFVHAIKSNTITHINNEHGENGTTDHSMADEKDIARIKYVLENYDTIERLPTDSKEFRDKNQRPAPTIKLSKRIDGTMYVVEAVPDTKKGQLPIISAYKTKAVQQTGTVHAPSPDAQSASADTAFNNTISQTAEKSNTQSEPRFRMRRMYDDTLDEDQKRVFERAAQGGGKYNATATAQTAEQTRAQTTAQKFGHRVVFYEGSDNGFIKDGTVYISRDAENPVMSVLGHELTHAVMADESIKKELISFVRAQTISENGALKGDYSDRFNQKKQLYQSRMENVTDDYILEEITADIGGDLFMSDEFINRITEEKPNIAVRIWRSIKDFIARVTGNGRYKDLSGSEIKQLRDAAKAAQKYEQAFIKARENMTSGNSEIKYMFAGKNAATADLSALATAEKMEQSGSTPEEIWTETGWSKGQDGKWRFEIDDSNFKIKADNLAEIHRNYKEIAQKENLIYRLENMSEQERKNRELGFTLLGLDEKYKTVDDEISKLKQDISELSKDKKTEIINGAIGYDLSDLVEGYALFEAYPDLKNVQVLISNSNELGKDNRGEWNRKNNTICLNGDYSVEEIESTLLHEIQHAIQSKEGFARGATPEYWQSKIYNVYNDKRFNKDAKTLYKNTAGEIEARDVQTRRNMTAEERRNTFPESMKLNNDVVFVDSGVSYFSSDSDATMSLKKQIQNSRDILNAMSVVKKYKYDIEKINSLPKERRKEAILNDYFEEYGTDDAKADIIINRKPYGEISVSKKEIRKGMRYLNSDGEFSAILAIPSVIQQGEEIYSKNDHKDRGYSTVTFAAPVEINGVRGNMAVTIKKTDKYKYKMHRILMPDGSVFEFSDNEKNSSYNDRATDESIGGSLSITTVSNNSITENGGNVNSETKFSLKKPVEETKDLIAVHNLTPEKLKGILELGGFPVPSIAITKADMEHSGYGDISVLFGKETIDPERDNRNDVFSADAYTSRFPQIDIKLKSGELKKIADRLNTSVSMLEANEFSKSTKEDIISGLKFNRNARETFLKENDIKVEPVLRMPEYTKSVHKRKAVSDFIARKDVTFEKLVNDDTAREEYMSAIQTAFGERKSMSGVPLAEKWCTMITETLDKCKNDRFLFETEENRFNTDKSIADNTAVPVEDAYSYIDGVDNAISDYGAEFDVWLNDLVEPAIGEKYVRKDIEAYKNNGDRRSFNEMHDAYTLENIVKNMNRGTNNESGFGSVGIGELRAATSTRFGSVGDVRAAKSKIQNLTDEQIQNIYEAATKKLSEVRSELYKYQQYKSGNDFIDLDNVGETVKDAFVQYTDANDVIEYLKEYYPKAPKSTFDMVIDLKKTLENLPVKYFEAKPHRAVGFDEVKAAVVPNDTSAEIKQRLENAGVRVVEYEKGNSRSRVDAVNSVDDIKFSLRKSEKAARFNSIADKLITETGTTLERGEVSAALEDIYNTLSASDYSAAAYAQALEDLKSLSRTAFENTGTVKDDTLYKENADLRQYLRTTAIAVNDSAKEDFGSKKDFNDFRRANFGRIRISNSGTPVDIIYKELSELYPQFFDENREMTQSDQLKRIAEVLDSIKPTVRSTYEGADIGALADSTADELFSSMLGVVGENAETGEKKKKVSRFRTNTIERAVMFSEEDLKNLSPQEFEYIPETEKEWNEQAVKNVSEDMESVMEKIRASESMTGGVMAQEAALISKVLTERYQNTGSAADLAEMTDWLKTISERTREAARALKATDSAWEKSPAAAIAKAQSVVQEEQDKKENPKSKKAKERKSTSKKHADEVNSIQDSGVERIADEVEKAFGEKADSASEKESKPRTTKRQRIESRTLEKFNITKEKEPNKAAFVSKVLSDLFGKISKTRKGADSGAKYSAAEQPKLDLWYSDIKAAIEGRGEYAEVWEEMYALAREEFAGDAKALLAIDDYFTNGKKPIVPLDALDKAINDAFSGMGTNIGQVVRDYFSDDNQTAAALSDYIIEKTGVSGEDADELARYVKERYREIVKDKQIKYLEREAAKLDKPRLVSTETIKRVSRHIDSVFSEEQLKEFERDALNRVNPRIAEYVREKGINLLDVVKHGVCDSELDNYKYLDGLLKELDGRITEKDIKDFSEAVYREFAKMPPVRNDKVLSRYFKIDKGGMIVTETIRPRTVLGDMLGLIDIAGKKRAGLVEEILKRNDGLVTLEQSDINAILNHMSAAADLDKDRREYKVEIARVKKIIEGKKQPSAGAAGRAYARINMLLNPKTIFTRNFGGNLLQAGIYNIENTISTGIDKMISKKTGIRTSAAPTKNNLKEQGKGFVKGVQDARKDYKEGVDTRDFDGRYDIGEGDPFTNKNVFGRGFNKVNRLTGAILDMGDRPFYEMHYNSVLEQLKRANNVSEATEEMIEIAREVALERTWQDENDFTKIAAGAKRLLNRIHLPGINYGAGDIVEPFVKTPANLFRAALKYSPAGVGKSLIYDSYKLMKAHKDGTLTMKMQRKYVDDLSKAIVGTLITIIGYALAKKGLFNGEDEDDDKVQKFREYVEGIMPNSLRIGDYSVSLSWLQPMGTPLSFGATLENEMKKDSGFGSKLIKAFANSMENVINASFIQGIRELLAENYETMFDKFLDAGEDGIMQMLPFGSLTKQLTNSIDNTVRSTYAPTDKDKFFNRTKQYYPGFSNTLEPRLNALGEQSQRTYDETPDKVSLADGAARVLNSFFNPANTRRISSTPLIKELNRVYDMTGDSSVYPSEVENKVTVDGKDYRLTSEQYTVYQRKVGTKIKEVLNALIVDDEKAGKYAGEKKDEITVTYAKMTEEERKKKESSIKTKAAAEYKESIDKKNVKINDLSLDERTELKRRQNEAVERFRNGEEQTNYVVWSDVPYSQLDDGQKAEVLSSVIKKARDAVKEELKEDWTKNAQPVFKMKGQ